MNKKKGLLTNVDPATTIIPFAIIFTKCDKQSAAATAAQIEKDREILLRDWESLPPMFASSSLKKGGREEILEYIGSLLSDK